MTNSRRFPAEWENQQGILLCFPHNGNDWPGKYGAIQWAFIEFIKKVTTFEEVVLVVADENLKEKVIGMLEIAAVNLKAVSFIIHKTNRSGVGIIIYNKFVYFKIDIFCGHSYLSDCLSILSTLRSYLCSYFKLFNLFRIMNG